MTPEDYRNRLRPGEVVYYVGEESGHYGKPGDKLIARKGSIDEHPANSGPLRQYPVVRVWREPTIKPVHANTVPLSPRILFTAKEVGKIMRNNIELAHLVNEPLDGLLDDPDVNFELTVALGVEAMERFNYDGTVDPNNLEPYSEEA